MTKPQPHFTGTTDWKALLRRWSASLCLLLFTVVTTASLAHNHPAASPEDGSHCSLCIAAHHAPAVAPQPAAPAPAMVATAAAQLVEPSPIATPARRPHDSRPPPDILNESV